VFVINFTIIYLNIAHKEVGLRKQGPPVCPSSPYISSNNINFQYNIVANGTMLESRKITSNRREGKGDFANTMRRMKFLLFVWLGFFKGIDTGYC